MFLEDGMHEPTMDMSATNAKTVREYCGYSPDINFTEE